MRTRSQAKQEKLDRENPPIPQLNEDIFGVILKHVLAKQKDYIMDTMIILDDNLGDSEGDLIRFTKEDGFIAESYLAYRIDWPDYLNSNIRRLIYHTSIKLFPHDVINIERKIESLIKSRQDLDILWGTFKYFGFVCFRNQWRQIIWPVMPTARFFRKFWRRMKASRKLVKKLEDRLA